MPKAPRRSLPKHEQAVPLSKAIDEDVDDSEMDIAGGEGEGFHAGEEVDADGQIQEDGAASATALPSQPNKKAKKKNKRAALMQKLAESSIPVSPYSKSHNKRLKKKQKQSLGLDSMTAALDDAMPTASTSYTSDASAATSSRPTASSSKASMAPPPESFLAKRSRAENKQLSQKAKTAPNKIGEDTVHKSMSARQRQKMLTEERNRLPAILSHKAFSANPFETIRLHAQNTIVPLEKSRRPEQS